ncbi:MAG TPA: DUF2339 domain-containing protein [Casimicrobiaceae bacterium]|nr:DUF2339 domain-containing protein [Casimicrobiaceae bacterium]
MPLLTTLLGALLGAVLGRGFDGAVSGGFIGLIAGLVLNAWRKNRRPQEKPAASLAASAGDGSDALLLLDPRVAERLRAMERRIETLETEMQKVGASVTTRAMPTTALVASHVARAPLTDFSRAEPAVSGASDADVALSQPAGAGNGEVIGKPESRPADETPTHVLPTDAPPRPAYAAAGGTRTPRERSEASALWRFVAGGNTLARVGVVVLFIGVAFLLKYASEHVSVPIELRLAGVALGGVVLLVLGWRLRERRSGYAMSLQGAAIGVLYLTVFAALRLYQLLPALAAFGLLFWIAALSSYLAVRQDSMALAILGIVGGFAAPVLTSTGAGSHVMLFSYYAVLNAGVFAIAWFKAWRLLNVIAFVCTFVIGTLWGVTRYRPEDFATTEPFLILFFLYYVGIATLYAMRRSLEVKRYVDATLVFATPLFAAGLQGALVRRIEYAMAWSAIGASAVYLVLARLLYTRHRDDLRLLVESYLALGAVFATLAVPLALDARLTSATWALEGAALVWIGARQHYLGPRAFGLALQVAAGVAFALGFSLWTHRIVRAGWPFVNSDFMGAVLISVGGVVSARVLSRAPDLRPTERALVPVVFAWGVLWWVGAGWQEIERFVAFDMRVACFVAFIAASAVLFAALARALDWPLARVPALAALPVMFSIAVFGVANAGVAQGHLFGAWGFVAWAFALGAYIALVRHFERDAPSVAPWALDASHAVFAWLVTLIAAHEVAWLARSHAIGGAWRLAPWGLLPMLALFTIARGTAGTRWPMGARMRAWLVVAAIPLVVASLVWALYANVASTGDASPLPFVPLVNPLDLTQALVFISIALWLQRVRGVEGNRLGVLSPEALGAVAAGLLLFWVTFATLRTLHHWADVPWSAAGIWNARIAQAALSIVWSIFALASMMIAHRLRFRAAWVGGAALLAVVVGKLFFVDLSQVGGVERIVSFMGVGVLLLIIGYVAPVPPRQESA